MSSKAKSISEKSNGRMIQVLSARLERVMAQRLKELDLSLREFAVLMTVLGEDGLTQIEIGQRFSMPAHVISRSIDSLEQKGLVLRQPHETSRRAVAVIRTKKGEALAPDLFSIVKQVNADLLAPLSDRDQKEFGRLLSILIEA